MAQCGGRTKIALCNRQAEKIEAAGIESLHNIRELDFAHNAIS